MNNTKSNEERLSVIETKLDNILVSLSELKKANEKNELKFASKDELLSLRSIVYWIIGIMGTVVGSVIVILIQKVIGG